MPTYFPAAQQPVGSTRTLQKEPDGSHVSRTVLPTGLRIISETVPGARSVTLGVWARVGSRDETPASAGAAHFLEHLLFKGTPARSALEISASMDAVGGETNAFTTKEYTCFYAKCLPKDMELAVDILVDITTDPLLSADDIEAERTVVLEEIGMHEDDASDRAHEALQTGVLGRSKLAKPILGTRESIGGMSPRTVRAFFRKHYQPQNLVVSAAGAVDHKELVQAVQQVTEGLDWPWGVVPNEPRAEKVARKRNEKALHLADWPGGQATVAIGTMGLPRRHEDRRALEVFSQLMGGGMSSRLFQSIREQHGLAYSVYAFHTPYSDAGVWGLLAGCSPATAQDVVALAQEQLQSVVDEGVSAEEVERAKGHLTGSIVLASEESSARMSRLGRAEISTGELLHMDEALARIDAVDVDSVNRIARDLLSQPRQAAIVGPLEDEATMRRRFGDLGFN